jgi:outer membrane protein assembly factor BamB
MTTDDREPEPAEILREYGPYPGVERVNGVTFDGERVWFAGGDRLHAIDPESGEQQGSLDVQCDAGTAFDGQHLYVLANAHIRKLDPATGAVLATIPAPSVADNSGLAWAEGSLWIGQYRDRKIFQVDPSTGAVLRTIESNRFVTGITWADGDLWHGSWEGNDSELRRVDPDDGQVLERLTLPRGMALSGLEADGGALFYCGGGATGKLRAVRRPKR